MAHVKKSAWLAAWESSFARWEFCFSNLVLESYNAIKKGKFHESESDFLSPKVEFYKGQFLGTARENNFFTLQRIHVFD